VSPEFLTLAGILIAMNGAILAYVVSIERRLTRLETINAITLPLKGATP